MDDERPFFGRNKGVHSNWEVRCAHLTLCSMALLIVALVVIFGGLTLSRLPSAGCLTEKQLTGQLSAATSQQKVETGNPLADLMGEHVQLTIGYLQNGRAPCNVAAGQRFVGLLMANLASWGELLRANGAPSVESTTKLLGPHITAAKQLIDSKLGCPCSGDGFFSPCDNKLEADKAVAHLTTNTGEWAQFLSSIFYVPSADIAACWQGHLQCTLNYIDAAKRSGIQSAEFQTASNQCIQQGVQWAKQLPSLRK